MRDGFYRLHYSIGTVSGVAVITVHGQVVAGCDRNFFLHGVYKQDTSRLSGTIVFEMHTWSEGRTDGVPSQFTVRFTGFGGTNYGQLEFTSPDLPAIKGQGRFTWLGEYQKTAEPVARQAI